MPLGIFGIMVTLGLLVYELHGMVRCRMLADRGAMLELAMQSPSTAAFAPTRHGPGVLPGHFLDRPQGHKLRETFSKLYRDDQIVTVPTASFLVYGSTLVGWIVVMCFGLAGFVE